MRGFMVNFVGIFIAVFFAFICGHASEFGHTISLKVVSEVLKAASTDSKEFRVVDCQNVFDQSLVDYNGGCIPLSMSWHELLKSKLPKGIYCINMPCSPFKKRVYEEALISPHAVYQSLDGREIPETHFHFFNLVFCPKTREKIIVDSTYLQFFCDYEQHNLSPIFIGTQQQIAGLIKNLNLKIKFIDRGIRLADREIDKYVRNNWPVNQRFSKEKIVVDNDIIDPELKNQIIAKFAEAIRGKDIASAVDIFDTQITPNNIDMMDMQGGMSLFERVIISKSLDLITRSIDYAYMRNQRFLLHSTVLNDVVRWNYDREVIQFLLAEGARVNAYDSSGVTPLYNAIINDAIPTEVVVLLLRYGADPNIVQFPDSITEAKGLLAVALKRLNHFNPEYGNSKGFSANKKIILDKMSWLLNFGADSNVLQHGVPLITWALWTGDENVVESLLSRKKINIDALSWEGISPLFYALERDPKKAFNMVEKLLKHGAQVNVRCRGKDSLMWLLENHKKYNFDSAHVKKMILLLLAHGAVITEPAYYMAPIDVKETLEYHGGVNHAKSLELSQKEVLKETKEQNLYKFLKAIKNDDFNQAVMMIKNDAIDCDGMAYGNPLLVEMLSVRPKNSKNLIEIIRLLLKNGASVNQMSQFGVSALGMALEKNQPEEVIALLINVGAHVNQHSNHLMKGRPGKASSMQLLSPLFIAITNHDVSPNIVKLLLDKGANIESREEALSLVESTLRFWHFEKRYEYYIAGNKLVRPVLTFRDESVFEMLMDQGIHAHTKVSLERSLRDLLVYYNFTDLIKFLDN